MVPMVDDEKILMIGDLYHRYGDEVGLESVQSIPILTG